MTFFSSKNMIIVQTVSLIVRLSLIETMVEDSLRKREDIR